MKRNFRGVATAYNILCKDGRTIGEGAFDHQDGIKVPLVYQHNHNDASQVIGHAILEAGEDVMYADCFLNNTKQGKNAAELVKHGDINALSIFANELKYANGATVIHGEIKEVSLVLSGANSGAVILSDTITHSDGTYTETDEACIIHSGYTNDDMEDGWDDGLYEDGDDEDIDTDDIDVEAVFDNMTPEQQAVVAMAVDAGKEQALKQSQSQGGNEMKHGNLFEGNGAPKDSNVLSHADIDTIFTNAQQAGSLRAGVTAFAKQNEGAAGISELAHAGAYGINNIEYLFPDYKEINSTPDFIKRDTTWVDGVLSGVHKRPFSKLKMTHADITADEARAKGYLKGNLKTEEVFGLLHRTVNPAWIYKKQKLDQEEIIEITDFNVVNWLWSEINVMLREEIARAMLFGDGRPKMLSNGTVNPDKIDETRIIPVCADAELYCVKEVLPAAITSAPSTSDEFVAFMEAVALSKLKYKGTGMPTLYCKRGMVDLIRIKVKDNFGQYVYKSKADIAAMMGVKDIVEIESFERVQENGDNTETLLAILVNLADYSMGINKGGEITKFTDFDIDFNQHKYLAETYFSSCLDKPFSAIAYWATEATS